MSLENWLRGIVDDELKHLSCNGSSSEMGYCPVVWEIDTVSCIDLHDNTYCLNNLRQERDVFYLVDREKRLENSLETDQRILYKYVREA